ncbi:glucohydrolase [Chimaeribacter arupi]|uniref:alpha-amylase family glycosyl hydrolase n=1 Tax=Chimaeribacter arupi TaxID=2060066 RepID=UPI000C7CDFA1|nr:alpha-amylase family glycosyl hydrolase [Chimaeribacter arupi]PLR43281.1 glucohydrolase [Chimaeribacter arupi]
MGEPVAWWRKGVFYQVYLPSFCDGNADGLGDFHGLLSKLDYLAELGIAGIWITPFYPSPRVDNGYDIADYCGVDPRVGNLALFGELVTGCRQRNIRVIIDLVINHVSSAHPWFQQALNAPDSPCRDYFLFRPQPNNWQSFFGGPAWTRESPTGEYYYHKFSPQQVDLNWGNPQVCREIERVIDFWLAQGVDGFRFDVINFLTTDGIGADNPWDGSTQRHEHDINQPGLIPVLTHLCRYIRQRSEAFLIGEVGSEDLETLCRYQGEALLDVVFNFNLGSQKTFSVSAIYQQLVEMEARQPGVPTLFFSSHDMSRMISRFGENARDVARAVALFALQITAKGVPFIYNGDELGLTDFVPECLEQLQDIQGITHYHTARAAGESHPAALALAMTQSRDASRAPMQWDDSPHAGFSAVPPWLPVHRNAATVNARALRRQPDSILNQYKQLIQLRNCHAALQNGAYQQLEQQGDCLLITRKNAQETLHILINFGAPRPNPLFGNGLPVLFGDDSRDLEKNHVLIKKGNHENSPQSC